MKRLMTAIFATMMALGTTAAFAQASGTMSNDSMSHDSMSKDSMKKSDKMKKNGSMGMDHPASGAMSQ